MEPERHVPVITQQVVSTTQTVGQVSQTEHGALKDGRHKKGRMRMQAIVCTKYGPPEVLQLREIEKPVPQHNEICVQICATAVTASDCIIRGFKLPRWQPMGLMMGLMLGFTKPRRSILGMVAAGNVESVGKDVTLFKEGDQVYTFNIMRFGTYAEYLCLSEKEVIALKPSNLTYEEAAAIPYGGMIALYYLRKSKIQSGQNILIYGASGAVGTAAVQLARYFGAHVTGVCSTKNIAFVRSLGADTVIDYTKGDFTNNGTRYDVVLDAVGKSKSAQVPLKNVLSANGSLISVDDGSPKLRCNDLALLTELAEAGQIKPVIDRSYALEQMVEAHRYVDKGHKKGNVIVTLGRRS